MMFAYKLILNVNLCRSMATSRFSFSFFFFFAAAFRLDRQCTVELNASNFDCFVFIRAVKNPFAKWAE